VRAVTPLSATAMEDLECRQLLSGGTFWKVTLNTPTTRPGGDTMLSLKDGARTYEGSSTFATTVYEEKPDGMSGEDFIKSLVSGTIHGTVWVGDPAVETPVSFSFPQEASTTQGDAPVYIQMSGDDTSGYSGYLFVDDDFYYEDPSGHSYNNAEWSFSIEPAPRVSVEAVAEGYQGSEDGRAPAAFVFHRDGAPVWAPYVIFTVGGSATVATLDENGNVTNPEVADYVLDGATPVEGSPGTFKAEFGGYPDRYVYIDPLNDSKVEGSEDVQLTIVADDTVGAGMLPAYADPAGNGAGQPVNADAGITDLITSSVFEAGQPSYAEIDDWIMDMGSDNFSTRETATDLLNTAYQAYPQIGSYLDERYDSGELIGEQIARLQRILGPVKFTVEDNTITTSMRFTPEGLLAIIPPADVTGATFSSPLPLGSSVFHAGDSIYISPTVARSRVDVTITYKFVDGNGNILATYACPIDFSTILYG